MTRFEDNTLRDVRLREFIDKPIVIFDTETTGVNVEDDRIVQFGGLRIDPGCDDEFKVDIGINPMIPIPTAASDIHGITGEMASSWPTFKEVADDIFEFIGDADLAGFNVLGFDLQILQNEFRRNGHELLDMSTRKVFDAMHIYHQNEPRNLEAALMFYCGRGHEDAHDAWEDVVATRDVIEAQIARYELPRDMALLHDMSMGDRLTTCGRLRVGDGNETIFAFGKHRGRALSWVAKKDQPYLFWVLDRAFPEEVKTIIRKAM